MTKVLTIVGTRPELIRLSRVIERLSRTVDHVLVHTGQNHHPALRDVLFTDLGLPQPDHQLKLDTSSVGRALAGVLTGAEEVIIAEQPDAVLVLGDTNSCLAALMARRMRVPVYHMEGGNRCFDLNVPEETNRRLVDHVSDFHLVYTGHARRNLLAEGIHPRRILLTGSPMREVLAHHRHALARAPRVLARAGVPAGAYFLVSAHREENVDDPERLRRLVDCLRAVHQRWQLPVLVSTHPRTAERLRGLGADDPAGVTFHEPFGFLDYLCLQRQARCVLSDSGTVSEESAILGFPAVTLREGIERPESLDAGSIIMTGLEPAGVMEAVATAVDQAATDGVPCPPEYRIEDTSRRVTNFLLSTVRRHHQWAGVRVPGGGPR